MSEQASHLDAGRHFGSRARPPVARRAEPGERQAVHAIMLSAFADDPLYRWLYPAARIRRDQLGPLFDVILDAAFAHEAVWVLDDFGAAAVWAEDPGQILTEATLARYMGHLAAQLDPPRLAAVTAAMAACGEHVPRTAHEVLLNIAVPVERQGAGGGSSLLRQLLERCDRRKMPAYLESSNPRNISFYERHGFHTLGAVRLPGSLAAMTPMLREPQP